MAEASLFDDFDAALLDRVTEAVGTRMAASIALSVVDVIRDDAVSPELMSAGLIRAHLLGAASAIAGAEAAGAIVIGSDERLVADAIEVMLAALTTMRATR